MSICDKAMVAKTNKDRNTAAMTMHEQTHTFAILYYKRKNKVHKSKGVSKMDGTLTIVPPPKSTITLKADGNNILYRGPLHPDIAKKGSFLFDLMDETISVGAYEVVILSVAGNNATTMTTYTNSTTLLSSSSSSSLSSSSASLLTRKIGPLRGVAPRIGRGPLHPRSSASSNVDVTATSTKVFAISKKRSLENRKPPAQPVKKVKGTTNERSDTENTDDEDVEDNGNGGCVSSSATASLVTRQNVDARLIPRQRHILPAFKRHTNAVGSSLATSVTGITPQTNITTNHGTSTASATSTSSLAPPPLNRTAHFFPGAIGNLDVPHGIKKVLKPHQIEGVSFLWNCLTGNGKVAQVSPHCYNIEQPSPQRQPPPPQQQHGVGPNNSSTLPIYKGCILSDEMGLGKTL
jgi:hypothetical protein